MSLTSRSDNLLRISGSLSTGLTPASASRATERDSIGNPDIQASKRIRSTTLGLLVGTVVVMLVGAAVTTGYAWGTALVFGLALTGTGVIVGLLFSMPKAISAANSSADPSTVADDSAADQRRSRLYSLNTNLEQVSDWLTKIIVGVGLVEAHHLTDYTWRAAVTLGGDFHGQQKSLDAGGATALAVAMIIGFPVFGFLIGFFGVRLYISRAMFAADSIILGFVSFSIATSAAVTRKWSEVTSVPADMADNGAIRASAANSPAVEEALSKPIDKLQTVSDLVTRGRAALLKGRSTEASIAFVLAIEKGGADPALFLDYARTFTVDPPVPWSRVIEILQQALAALTPLTLPEVRQQIYWELLNAYLYTPPPNGYNAALQLGENYIATNYGRYDPCAYVYLAAAHGQAYGFLKAARPDLAAVEVPTTIEKITRALDFAAMGNTRNAIRRWICALATNASTDPNDDNDLYAIAHDHPQILSLLGVNDGGTP